MKRERNHSTAKPGHTYCCKGIQQFQDVIMLLVGWLSESIQAAHDLDINYGSIRNFVFQIKFQCTAIITFQNHLPEKINGFQARI
jgi:hypothetical protein